MSPDILHNPIWHRLKGQFYRLEGNECSNCGKVHFPPKAVCPLYEVTETFVGMGTVTLAYSQSENGKSSRQIEFSVDIQGEKLQVKLSLIGRNHSLNLKAGMQVPVFARKSLNGGSPLYYSVESNQLASEPLIEKESSKSSK